MPYPELTLTMVTWIQSLITYPGIVFLMFLENVFPPIPSELIMPLAGFKAGKGELTLWGVILAGTIGSLIGQLPLYYLGKFVGEKRLSEWADKYGQWLTVSGDDIKKAEGWFDKYGTKIVLLGRLIPGVRSLLSIPAGISGMNLPQFLLYSALGGAAWNTLLATLGYWLGERYESVEKYLGPATYVVMGGGAIYLIVQVIRRRARKKAKGD